MFVKGDIKLKDLIAKLKGSPETRGQLFKAQLEKGYCYLPYIRGYLSNLLEESKCFMINENKKFDDPLFTYLNLMGLKLLEQYSELDRSLSKTDDNMPEFQESYTSPTLDSFTPYENIDLDEVIIVEEKLNLNLRFLHAARRFWEKTHNIGAAVRIENIRFKMFVHGDNDQLKNVLPFNENMLAYYNGLPLSDYEKEYMLAKFLRNTRAYQESDKKLTQLILKNAPNADKARKVLVSKLLEMFLRMVNIGFWQNVCLRFQTLNTKAL